MEQGDAFAETSYADLVIYRYQAWENENNKKPNQNSEDEDEPALVLNENNPYAKDIPKALEFLEASTIKGEPDAAYRLGLLNEVGQLYEHLFLNR